MRYRDWRQELDDAQTWQRSSGYDPRPSADAPAQASEHPPSIKALVSFLRPRIDSLTSDHISSMYSSQRYHIIVETGVGGLQKPEGLRGHGDPDAGVVRPDAHRGASAAELLHQCFVDSRLFHVVFPCLFVSPCPQEGAAEAVEEEDAGATAGAASSSSGGPACSAAPVPFDDAVRDILDEHGIDAHARCRQNAHEFWSQSPVLDHRSSSTV